ncbi:MAG: CoA protein activase [Firmicutes bacterium]|nr:CoA protein activase [Bacillota bacterium]
MRRRITFPHMGTSHIAIRGMLESIGLEVVTPPPITRRTLSLGTQYSPEFACLPLKINLGNFIEAYEMGANTVVMSGGWGPCRFGYYAQVQREILKDLGCPMEMIVLEAPDSRITGILNQVKDLAEGASWLGIIGAVKFGWEKVRALDEVEMMAQEHRPRVADQGAVERIYQESLKEIDRAASRKEVRDAAGGAKEKFASLGPDWEKEVARVGIIGEIYTVLEPFVNLNIERHLGRLGAEAKRSIYLSQWVNDHLFLGLMPGRGTKELIKNAQPYLNYWVGGHGRETIGAAVYLSQLGYDGVIQLGPLTCMPEIVAQSILPLVSAREDIPAMTLYFDEHTGEAGLLTRIEAFLELLRRKKANRKGTKQLREA